MGSLRPLRGYQGEDIELQLPDKLTVYSIDWLAVWCVEYRHNFGHVYMPKDLDVPPALGQTKITVSLGVWVDCCIILNLNALWYVEEQNLSQHRDCLRFHLSLQ